MRRLLFREAGRKLRYSATPRKQLSAAASAHPIARILLTCAVALTMNS
jgi:hypothetical protein